MEINKHICFTNEKNPQLLNYLIKNNISFKKNGSLCIIDIYESSPYWSDISAILGKEKALCISDTRFSKKELQSAEWMTLRSVWHNGYPQPEGNFDYEDITYTRDNKCSQCGVGLRQIDSFRLKKAPNWGSRHFMMLNWIEDELFVSEHAKNLLERSGFTDISFSHVKNKSGKEILPDVFQLNIRNVIPKGLVEGGRNLREIPTCSQCNSTVYHPSGIGMHSFRKEIFDSAPDIVKTTDMFGWGKAASPLIIVNQKVYRFIIENRLERGLEFQPIELV